MKISQSHADDTHAAAVGHFDTRDCLNKYRCRFRSSHKTLCGECFWANRRFTAQVEEHRVVPVLRWFRTLSCALVLVVQVCSGCASCLGSSGRVYGSSVLQSSGFFSVTWFSGFWTPLVEERSVANFFCFLIFRFFLLPGEQPVSLYFRGQLPRPRRIPVEQVYGVQKRVCVCGAKHKSRTLSKARASNCPHKSFQRPVLCWHLRPARRRGEQNMAARPRCSTSRAFARACWQRH